MADAIDQTTDAAGTAEEVDTSNTEDINLDDVSWEDGDTVEDTEDSDADSAATDDADDTDEESDDDVADEGTESKETESEDAPDKDEAVATDPKESEAEAEAERQRVNNEAAARRIAEKQQRELEKQQAAQELLDSSYTDAYDQAINAGFDDQQARIQAAQALSLQQLQIDAYQNRVMQVTNRVTADLNNAVSAIPEFKSTVPEVREAMLSFVDDFEAQHVVKDANGDVVQITGDLLPFLQAKAETIRRLTGLGAKQQEQAKSAQKKRTMSAPSRTPKTAKVDPDMAAFDEAIKQWS